MLILLLDLLHRYWKPLALAGAILLLTTGAYFKGYENGKNKVIQKVEHTVYVEVEKRHEEAQKEGDRIEQKIERYKKSRDEEPVNDKRDSCILSNDPFESECVQ